MFFVNKKAKFEMDDKQAQSTLQNVFKACNIKEIVQAKSLKEIQERQKKEHAKSRLLFGVTGFFLLLLLLAPFAFCKPIVDLQTQNNSSGMNVFQHHTEDGIFYLSLSGNSVDYEHVEIYNSSGELILPSSFDEKTNTITFSYNNEELNLFIPDENGNTLHLLLTPKNN